MPSEGLLQGGVQDRREVLLGVSRECLEAGDVRALGLFLNDLHPADLADLFRQLSEAEQQEALGALEASLAAATLAEMSTSTMLDVTEDLDAQTLSGLVEEMEPDDAADVLGDLPVEQSAEVLEQMEPGEAKQVRQLLAHQEDTGGGIMTSRLIAVRETVTVADATEALREGGREDDIFCLYVVDENQRLLGTVPLRRLLLAPQTAVVRQLTDHDPISVSAGVDQEEIAHVFVEYDLLALPVVDADGRLVGQVTVDDIVEVLEQEATEDIYEMAAISPRELEERSAVKVAWRRLPWLLICLAGTLIAGSVIDSFAPTLAQVGTLVLFVPAIMAMGGNTGIQTSTVMVRNMATGQLQPGDVWRGGFREVRIALGMGVVLGSLVLAVAQWWTGNALVGVCVGLAMFAAIVLAAALGAFIPLLFRKLGIDPAIASGPLITTLNDGLSLVIYFTIATMMLHEFVPA